MITGALCGFAGALVSWFVSGCTTAQQTRAETVLDCIAKADSAIPMNPNDLTLANAVDGISKLRTCLNGEQPAPDAGK